LGVMLMGSWGGRSGGDTERLRAGNRWERQAYIRRGLASKQTVAIGGGQRVNGGGMDKVKSTVGLDANTINHEYVHDI
jgi:hypothetical protein